MIFPGYHDSQFILARRRDIGDAQDTHVQCKYPKITRRVDLGKNEINRKGYGLSQGSPGHQGDNIPEEFTMYKPG